MCVEVRHNLSARSQAVAATDSPVTSDDPLTRDCGKATTKLVCMLSLCAACSVTHAVVSWEHLAAIASATLLLSGAVRMQLQQTNTVSLTMMFATFYAMQQQIQQHTKALVATQHTPFFLQVVAVSHAAQPPSCDAGGACEADFKGEWYGEFFPGIPKIPFEGPDSKNPLAFRYYNASEVIMGKTMKEW